MIWFGLIGATALLGLAILACVFAAVEWCGVDLGDE